MSVNSYTKNAFNAFTKDLHKYNIENNIITSSEFNISPLLVQKYKKDDFDPRHFNSKEYDLDGYISRHLREFLLILKNTYY